MVDEYIKKLSLGQKIKIARTTVGLTQDALAKKLGYSQCYISELENNAYEPKWSTMTEIVNITRKTYEWFEG